MQRDRNLFPAIGTMALGAGLMYFMDPEEGRHRRALVRDKFVHLGHETEDFVSGQTENLKNHAKGWMHEAKSMFRHEGMEATVDDSMGDPMDGSMSEPTSDTFGTDFVTND